MTPPRLLYYLEKDKPKMSRNQSTSRLSLAKIIKHLAHPKWRMERKNKVDLISTERISIYNTDCGYKFSKDAKKIS